MNIRRHIQTHGVILCCNSGVLSGQDRSGHTGQPNRAPLNPCRFPRSFSDRIEIQIRDRSTGLALASHVIHNSCFEVGMDEMNHHPRDRHQMQ